ncbi:MAG: RNA chaperone Hfq [Candidatus Muirbacterium halophilum]|nr:RNA chaperone Hfq [Candidatus Muirbacterium halophilum]MCK9475448.1 RNA chaperone Hfq [Candidatus Muirbacterium halophilum]
MSNKINLQDLFLDNIIKKRSEIMIFLTNGIKLRGYIKAYDSFTVLMEDNEKQQLIFKHAISTLVSSEKVEIK